MGTMASVFQNSPSARPKRRHRRRSLRVAGLARWIGKGPAGDLYLAIVAAASTWFKGRRHDLYLTSTIRHQRHVLGRRPRRPAPWTVA